MPTNNNDVIHLENLDNVNGLGGNDLFHWSGGNATIDGGADNFDNNPYQPYQLEHGIVTGDMLRINSDQGAFISFNHWNAGYGKLGNDVVTFTDVERIYGSAGNDTIRAGGATSHDEWQGISIFAGAGNDDIVGSAFEDVIDGGSGNDTIRAGAGSDFINSSTGDDLIYGGEGNENIRWGIGDAHWHNPGNDTIYGGDGRDLINVWVKDGDFNGQSRVAGGLVTIEATRKWHDFQGTATVGTGDGNHATLKFQGFEQGWTHEGNDTIDGSNAKVYQDIGFQWGARWGNDILIGSSGNDTLEGGEGRDTITGGKGNDLISANGDYYSMSAPSDGDVDTIIFNRGDGHDTIVGFDSGLDNIQSDMNYTANRTNQGTLLTFESGDTILVSNVFDW